MRTILFSIFAILPFVPAASADTVRVHVDYEFPNEWVTPVMWEPVGVVQSSDSKPPCDVGTTMNGQTVHDDDVFGWSACVTIVHEGAAGSVYHTYSYALYRESDGKIVLIEWSLQQVQCVNSDEPERSRCVAGQAEFWEEYDPEDVVAAVLDSLRLDENGSEFTDVPTNHVNADAIAYLKHEGIIEGYADGTFRPEATINRAEFVKILIGAYHAQLEEEGVIWEDSMCISMLYDPEIAMAFSDVAKTAWYAGPVCRAYSLGFVSGYPDGSFRPANVINFVEAAKILAETYSPGSFEYFDCDGCAWYRKYVVALEMKAAIPLSIGGLADPITRGEMAEMIFRLRTDNNDKQSRTYAELANQ